MSHRLALFAATSSLLALANPAFAHGHGPIDDRYVDVTEAVAQVETVTQQGSYDGEWDGAWQGEDAYAGEWTGTYTDVNGETVIAEYDGVFIGDARFVSEDGQVLYRDGQFGWREDGYVETPEETGAHYASQEETVYISRSVETGESHRHSGQPALAYTAEQRAEWLAQCRQLRHRGHGYYEDEDDDSNPGMIGSILGAVVGGVAGNRIAGRGDRLAGTLIGAGVGGLAGAVLGNVIGDGDDDEDYRDYYDADYGTDYCEAYLLNYERGYGLPQNTVAHAPVVMHTSSQYSGERYSYEHAHTTRRYEWVEEEVEVVVEQDEEPVRIQREIAPRPQGKLQPIK